MQQSEAEEEETENDSSSQELINSAFPSPDMNFAIIDPALLHNLDPIEPMFDGQFRSASPPSSQSQCSQPSHPDARALASYSPVRPRQDG